MHYAIAQNDRESVDKLLAKGVPIDCKNIQGHTPLFTAHLSGNVGLVRCLLQEKGADIKKEETSRACGIIATSEKRHGLADVLLKERSDPRIVHQLDIPRSR